jgi:hypothetical protein
MEPLASLLPVLLIGGLLYIFIISIRDAVKLNGSEKIAWVCLIIFLFPLGSIIFLLAKPKSK